MPGHEKIDSITNAPESTKPMLSAISVTTGSSAFGTACRRITRRRDRPIARPVVM